MFSRKHYAWSVLIIVFAFRFAAQAADVTGTWAIQDLQIANKVMLSMNVVQVGKGSFNNSSAFELSDLRGLTTAQMASPAGTMARFELVREAGIFAMEGYFKAGNGAGTFVFRSDPGFLQQMRALGFLDVSENRQFSMAAQDIGPRFAAEIRATGVAVSQTDRLVAMRIHGVSGDFIRRIQQVGYQPQSEDLVKLRIHGVTEDFANDVRQMYASASLEDLVRMRIHGAGVEFARDVRQAYPAASIDDLVRLRIHGVSMEYIRNMQSQSRAITLEQLVRLKIHGIQ